MIDVETCARCEYTRVKTQTSIRIDGVNIDSCIRDELRKLWGAGIRTTCSCCGHGDPNAAYIVVDHKDAPKMLALGYEQRPPRDNGCECGDFFRSKKMLGEVKIDYV